MITEPNRLILKDITSYHRQRMDKPLIDVIRDARQELETESLTWLMQQVPNDAPLGKVAL